MIEFLGSLERSLPLLIGFGLGAVAFTSMILVRRRASAPLPPPYGRIEADDERIDYRRENGVVDSVTWNELARIRILTTSDGPFLPDVFWFLEDGDGRSIKIPSEAESLHRLSDRLVKLPEFRNEEFTEAMTSTRDASFTVWER